MQSTERSIYSNTDTYMFNTLIEHTQVTPVCHNMVESKAKHSYFDSQAVSITLYKQFAYTFMQLAILILSVKLLHY